MRQSQSQSRPGSRSGWATRWIPVALVVALLASGFAVAEYDLGDRWFGASTTSPSPDPDPNLDPESDRNPDPDAGTQAAAPPATGASLPVPAQPVLVAPGVDAADDRRTAPRKVARLLKPLLADRDLGPHVVAAVADLSSGRIVYRRGAEARPASTTKLLTAVAALHVLGPDHRFTTSVVLQGRGGSRRLVLVGGGDPYLASKPVAADEPAYPERADLRTLARQTVAALARRGVARVRLGYDDSLFTGPDASARWEPGYVRDGVVSRIRALWVDEGRPAGGAGRVADPSLTAATAFATELRAAGLAVTGQPVRRRAARAAIPVAEVQGAALAQIVERMLTVSDNEAAEVLAHQVGLATGGDASFEGGVAGVTQALTELGVPLAGDEWYDGSGLSRQNRLTPETLLAVLGVAASGDHPELRAVISGLPVAGFSGSLEYRFADVAPAARGRVRAKTGTLRNTSSLAGIATDLDGTSVAFVLMADRVPVVHTLAAQEALDAAAAALGGCHCSVGAGG